MKTEKPTFEQFHEREVLRARNIMRLHVARKYQWTDEQADVALRYYRHQLSVVELRTLLPDLADKIISLA
jgi:hypothetical protein